MTCGIYVLYFETDDEQYYVGKSVDIEGRYRKHCSELRRVVHHNKALTSGYSKYGEPSMQILETLPLDDNILYSREVHWIETFDSFRNGMNETPGGEGVGFGENSPRAVFSNHQIEEVLHLLVDTPELTFIEVFNRTGVSSYSVQQIARGACHTWLATKYPEKYKALLALIGTRDIRKGKGQTAKDMGITYPPIMGPENVVYYVDSIRAFAREHNLDQGDLGKVLRGHKKSVKGWRLV